MEDPVSIDVYGKLARDKRNVAVKQLQIISYLATEIDARKAINSAIREDSYIILLENVGWREAQEFSKSCDWATSITFAQQDYYPEIGVSFCEKHNFYYGGILGCHICKKFYRE